LGLARGTFVSSIDPGAPQGTETALELYYNTPIANWMHLSPSLQYIANPGGTTGGSDTLVLGLRLQILVE
jgi:carbohydrate-selective porin OprB